MNEIDALQTEIRHPRSHNLHHLFDFCNFFIHSVFVKLSKKKKKNPNTFIDFTLICTENPLRHKVLLPTYVKKIDKVK